MKTAICFTGTGRSIKHTHDNLKKYLIDSIGDCDVFMLIAENPYVEDVQRCMNISQTKKFVVEKDLEYDLTRYNWRAWPPPRSSPQTYIRMIKSRERCGNILSEYEVENNINYDRVIFSRLDVNYFDDVSQHINGLDLECLYVPDFHNNFNGQFNGCNDRFALSNKKNMDIYFKVSQGIEEYCDLGNFVQGEIVLLWHLLNNNLNLRKIPVRFTRVRPDGEEIDIRLKNGPLET